MRISVFAMVAFALLAPVQVSAQGGTDAEGDDQQRMSLIEEFDADGDGRLNEEERFAARRIMRDHRTEAASPEERPRRERATTRRGGRGARGEDQGPPEGRRRRTDDRPERRVGRRARRPDRRPIVTTNDIFERFDADRDDSLNRVEFRALVAEVGRMLGNPPGPRREGWRPGGPPAPGQQFGPPRRGERFGRSGRGPDGRDFGPPRRGRFGRGFPDRPSRNGGGQAEEVSNSQPAQPDPI